MMKNCATESSEAMGHVNLERRRVGVNRISKLSKNVPGREYMVTFCGPIHGTGMRGEV
jgi:hypothetical protein